MLHTDLLHHFLLTLVEPVHIAVDVIQVHILIVVRLEVLHRGQLAHRLGHTGDDQMAQHLIVDAVETDAVIHLAKQQLGPIEQN